MLKNLDLNKINGYLLLLFTVVFPLSRAVASMFMAYFVLYFLYSLISKNIPKDFFKNRLVIALLLYITYMFSTNLWNGIDNKIYETSYYQWFAIFGIAIYLYKNPQYIYKTITAFILGMFVSEILSYGMYFDLWTINGKGHRDPTPFMQHIMYSVFLAVASILLLNRVLSKQYNPKEKILFSIFFFTITSNLLISNGRTGQIGFVAAIIIVYLLHFKNPIKSFFISISLILIIFFTGYNMLKNFEIRVDNTITNIKSIINHNYNTSWGLRVGMWIVANDLVKEKPIFGYGVGGVNKATSELFKQKDFGFSKETKVFISKNHLHNQYLQTISEGGLVGLFLLFLLYFYILRLNINNKELKQLSILFVTIYIISSIGDPLLIKQFTRILFIVFIGIFLGASLQTRIEND